MPIFSTTMPLAWEVPGKLCRISGTQCWPPFGNSRLRKDCTCTSCPGLPSCSPSGCSKHCSTMASHCISMPCPLRVLVCPQSLPSVNPQFTGTSDSTWLAHLAAMRGGATRSLLPLRGMGQTQRMRSRANASAMNSSSFKRKPLEELCLSAGCR